MRSVLNLTFIVDGIMDD